MQTQTLCRSCSAACGIVVETDADRVLSVRGDPRNSRSEGYICPKGASLAAFHHSPDRLEEPICEGQTVDWEHCLGDLASRLSDVRARLGQDGIALYQGTGAVSDSLALPAIASFITGLETQQFYSAATVDVAPALRAAEMVCGFASPWPVWRPEDPASRFALLIGFNPALSHGYLTMLPNATERLRRFRDRGGEIWVMDPRRTRTSELADRHLAVRPGSDAVLLAWLIRELITQEPGSPSTPQSTDFERYTSEDDRAELGRVLSLLDRDRVLLETGLEAADLMDLVATIRKAGRISVVAGTGVTLSRDALLTEWLRWVLLIVTGSLDREGGMWFNPGYLTRFEETSPDCAPPEGWLGVGPRSRPELPRILDQHPCVALVDEIEAGHVGALIVAGSSPLTAFPDPARLQAALRRLDVLAVIDIVRTPLSALASHVLPATGQLERADLVTETRTCYAPAVVAPVAGRRPMWWILEQLGSRLGVDLREGMDPAKDCDERRIRAMAAGGRESVDTWMAAGPEGCTPPLAYGWVRERALPEGRWRLQPPGLLERLAARLSGPFEMEEDGELLLICGRQLTRTNATAYMPLEKSRDAPCLRMHPADAEVLGLREGEGGEIASGSGRLAAEIRLDASLRRGVVLLAHGWFDVNVAQLISSREPIDPLTGQPVMSGIPVRISRA
jgi:anaerobic selenocysteine-containing dehydrogenase